MRSDRIERDALVVPEVVGSKRGYGGADAGGGRGVGWGDGGGEVGLRPCSGEGVFGGVGRCVVLNEGCEGLCCGGVY